MSYIHLPGIQSQTKGAYQTNFWRANYFWRAVVLRFRVHQNHLESNLKHRLLACPSRVCNSVGLGQRV